jgi:hypothetical protein
MVNPSTHQTTVPNRKPMPAVTPIVTLHDMPRLLAILKNRCA